MKKVSVMMLCTLASTSFTTHAANAKPLQLPQASPGLRTLFPYKPLVEKQKRVLPNKPMHTRLVKGQYQDRIIVKWSERHKIRMAQGQFRAEPSRAEPSRADKSIDKTVHKEMDRLNELMATRPKPPARLFKETEQQIETFRLKGEQRSHKELADLNAYYHILVDDLEKEEIEIMVDTLNRSDLVEIAYVPAIPSDPVLNATPYDIIPSATPLLVNQQGYLGAAPVGINALWAWATPPYNANIRGEGIRLTDIERGWDLGHEDLGFVTGDLLNTFNSVNNVHGTAVLGEIIGASNDYGITGIANQVDISMYGVEVPPFSTQTRNLYLVFWCGYAQKRYA